MLSVLDETAVVNAVILYSFARGQTSAIVPSVLTVVVQTTVKHLDVIRYPNVQLRALCIPVLALEAIHDEEFVDELGQTQPQAPTLWGSICEK